MRNARLLMIHTKWQLLDRTEDIAQVLDFTFCVAQFGSPGWGVTIDIVQVTLGALMCLLVTIQFVRQTLQMYKATKQLQPSQYLSLFMREGMFYFFACVSVSFFPSNSIMTDLLTSNGRIRP